MIGCGKRAKRKEKKTRNTCSKVKKDEQRALQKCKFSNEYKKELISNTKGFSCEWRLSDGEGGEELWSEVEERSLRGI